MKTPSHQNLHFGLLTLAACLSTAPASLHATELVASDGAPSDVFGISVSQSGSIGLVAAQLDDITFTDQGSAYVFRNLDTATGTVTQHVKLTASDGAANDSFGTSVSQSGGIGLVGASADDVAFIDQGSAYVFRNLDTATGTVTQHVKLTASDSAANDFFGASVSQSGSVGLIGAYLDDITFTDQGSAYVFRNLDTATGTVAQHVKLTASDGAANDFFGVSVSQSGSIGLVGAALDDSRFTDQGSAYVFRNLDTVTGTVAQNVKLTASDGAAEDRFGISVSQSGSIGLVGAYLDDITFADQGSAYVFRNLDTATGTVTQNVKLTASDGAAGDLFGTSVSQSGSIGLIGAFLDDITFADQGSAYVFRNLDTATGTVTQHVKLTASDRRESDYFGISVSLSGDQFTIGAYGKNLFIGKAYSGSVSSVTTLDAGSTSRTIDGLSFVSQDDWIIGQTTSSNQVTLHAGDTGNVTAGGKAVYIGQNAGSNNNTLLIAGSLTASQIIVGAAGNTGNTLEAAAAGALGGTSRITLNTGSTLLLSNSGTTDRISNSAMITLTGGKIAFSGNITEGPSPGTGALILTADSIIDFGGGNDVINFGASGTGNPNPWTAGTTLSIYNWGGSYSGGGNDQLIFGRAQGDASLTSTQLGQISFYEGDVDSNFLGTGQFVGLMGEVVPVPEPSSLILALLGLAGWRESRRGRRAVRSSRS